MVIRQLKNWSTVGVLGLALMGLANSGCQTSMGGQTLPSAYYLDDDVQFFPAGPEEQLYNQREVLEQYKLERESQQQQ
ncbi:hypothetical protein Pan153_08000 [Gimesia panareensis]|uniref:Secreted protein n=2 Tax=Gimesia panareensis TaxID=2527978 RepID=A0A517Q4M9_9PLAN|nr:hypothetical protein Enr10x_18740 [Gimesia panareensis]QDU50551.1 hypothetical protein Pan110_29030 [Gimesia panareensis]QDV16179.1 hypothetical protein Pan153_08000 [Gimesia panareensis]